MQLITLGIGAPGDISHLLLLGLGSAEAPVIADESVTGPRLGLRWWKCGRCGVNYPETKVVVQKGGVRCTGRDTNGCADDEYGAAYYRRQLQVPYEKVPEPPENKPWEDD